MLFLRSGAAPSTSEVVSVAILIADGRSASRRGRSHADRWWRAQRFKLRATIPWTSSSGLQRPALAALVDIGMAATKIVIDNLSAPCVPCHHGWQRSITQRGLLCPLCTSALRRYLRLDELLVPRCADPRALPLPMILHAHVLTACVPLSCRLSAAVGRPSSHLRDHRRVSAGRYVLR